MSYKIVVDSCCELPEHLKNDPRFERVPLTLIVGDVYERLDDESFDQREFLDIVASSPVCPRSACPSPERFFAAYKTDADHVYAITLPTVLSGSYNSAQLGKKLYIETYGQKDIHVIDSYSASCGELQLVYMLMEYEEMGLSFEEITKRIDKYADEMHTYFVLDNLETLRKNGRLSSMKAMVASTLNIKPLMRSDKGTIIQIGQGIGLKKAFAKLVDTAISEVKNTHERRLMISHCNNPAMAEFVKNSFLKRVSFKETLIIDMAGLSSLYTNEGGMIVTL